MAQNSPKSKDTGPSHSNQLSGGMLDQFHNLPLPLQSPVHRHIADLTCKDDESDSSQEEPDSFSFTLTCAEQVSKVEERGFLDFSVIFKRHLRCLYGLREDDSLSGVGTSSDMSVKDCAKIFIAFQAENARWHPWESTLLPREDRDRCDCKDKNDLVSEEWLCGSSC